MKFTVSDMARAAIWLAGFLLVTYAVMSLATICGALLHR